MIGQALSRVRNPYSEATPLERRRVQRVLRWVLDLEQRVEDIVPAAIVVALSLGAIEILANASRGWSAQ